MRHTLATSMIPDSTRQTRIHHQDILMAPGGSRKRGRRQTEDSSTTELSTRSLLPKRRRTDKFHRGQIARVTVKNFTTYADGEFRCSPTLNLVIGPNGTGKLTLVAAICLGLGGDPKLISRDNMKLMIRAGQSLALVEVELVDDPANIVIRRDFNAKTLTWYINGLIKLEKEVLAKVKEFNIQLDNLCHFLPQERVSEFALMDSKKLLEETQRTLGDGHLLKWHRQLIAWDNELQESEDERERLLEMQKTLEVERDKLMEEKDAYELYQAKKTVVDVHRELIPFAQKHDMAHQLQQTKQDYEEAKLLFQRHEQLLEPMRNILEEATVKADRLRQGRNSDSLKTLKQTQHTLEDKIDRYRENFKSIQGDIVLKRKKAMDSQKLLLKKNAERKKYLERLKELPGRVAQSEIDEIRDERNRLRSEQADIQRDIDINRDKISDLQRQAKQCSNQIKEYDRRLTTTDNLLKLDPEGNGGHGRNFRFQIRAQSYQAHLRLRRLKESGEDVPTYWECPVVSCWAKDPSYAKYLEAAMDNNSRFSITVTSNEDAKRIEKLLGSDINAPLRVISREQAPNLSRNVIAEYGFDGVLSDFLEGPKEVIQMLISTLYLNLIPVKKAAMNPDLVSRIAQSESLFTQHRVRRFMENFSLYNMKKSAYGSRDLWYTTEKIRNAQYFGNNKGLTEDGIQRIEQAKAELNLKLREITAEIQTLEDGMRGKRDEVKDLQEQFNELGRQRDTKVKVNKDHDKVEQRIKEVESEISELETLSPEHFSDEVKKSQEELVQAHRALARKRLDLSNHLGTRVGALAQYKFVEFKYIDAESRSRNAQGLMSQLDAIGKDMKQVYQAAKKAYQDAKSTDRLIAIENAIRLFYERADLHLRQRVEGLMNEYKTAETFSEANMIEKVQHLEEELLTLQGNSDRSAIENFHRKQQDLDKIANSIPQLEATIQENALKIEELLPRWLSAMKEYVERISDEFNRRFTKDVASDGRVELGIADRYRDYELRILTQFRPTAPLKVLDHQSQSGGERAVATIFFIMSIQGLTDAPFRVVDEINQGMDPTNERAAHRNLVQTASVSPESQYFLVTPKLLTGLYYSKDMAIHCIYAADSDHLVSRATAGNYLDFRALVK